MAQILNLLLIEYKKVKNVIKRKTVEVNDEQNATHQESITEVENIIASQVKKFYKSSNLSVNT